MVVALIFCADEGDGVAAHVLAEYTVQVIVDFRVVHQARNRCGQGGVSLAIDLGLVVGGDGHLCRVDSQVVDILSGLVVGVLRLHGDGHGAHILDGGEVGRPFRAAVGAVASPWDLPS